MKKLDLQPNTDEWLEVRKKYRTASEAPIVLGISPFTTPEAFKLIKAGLKKQYYSKAMQLGHELEDKSRQWANERFGKDFKEEIWVNGDYLASLDGIDDGTVLEIKTSDITYNKLKDGIIEEHYHAQIQQQLHCCGGVVAYLVAYGPKADDFAISEPIFPAPHYIEEIAKAWEKFDAMPVPEQIDFSDNGEVVTLFQSYQTLKETADNIKEQMDEIKQQLIAKAQDHSIEAQGYKLTKSKPRTSYDYSKACKDAKLDMEQYKKVGDPSWSIKMAPNPFEAIE